MVDMADIVAIGLTSLLHSNFSMELRFSAFRFAVITCPTDQCRYAHDPLSKVFLPLHAAVSLFDSARLRFVSLGCHSPLFG